MIVEDIFAMRKDSVDVQVGGVDRAESEYMIC